MRMGGTDMLNPFGQGNYQEAALIPGARPVSRTDVSPTD